MMQSPPCGGVWAPAFLSTIIVPRTHSLVQGQGKQGGERDNDETGNGDRGADLGGAGGEARDFTLQSMSILIKNTNSLFKDSNILNVQMKRDKAFTRCEKNLILKPSINLNIFSATINILSDTRIN